MHEIGLVRRRHQHETGQTAEIGDVEGTGMGRAVGTDQTGAIDRKAYRQPLYGDVVHHLVIGALQEGRINGREWLEALRCQAASESHRMLLGDADVEEAVGKLFGKLVETGAGR